MSTNSRPSRPQPLDASLPAGRDGLAATVGRHNALARRLAAAVDAAADFERLAPVELSIVCFRYVPDALRGGFDATRLDHLNKIIMEAVQTGGEAFLTQAILHDRFALRANVLHYATTEADITALIEIVRRTGERLTNE